MGEAVALTWEGWMAVAPLAPNGHGDEESRVKGQRVYFQNLYRA